ncbi:MAG TPA: hypothetical protein VFJ43_18090 [Bacteroidia bacterium]|nr:hypothetical protein [Bacteroidia bacterium]
MIFIKTKLILPLILSFFSCNKQLSLFKYDINDNCDNYVVSLPYEGYFENYKSFLSDTSYVHGPSGDFDYPECFSAFHSSRARVKITLSPDIIYDSTSMSETEHYPGCIYIMKDTLSKNIHNFFYAYYAYNDTLIMEVSFEYLISPDKITYFNLTEFNPTEKIIEFWRNDKNIKRIMQQ